MIGRSLWSSRAHEFLGSLLLLFFALVLAVMSAYARRDGEFHAAAFLGLVALIFASLLCFTLIPQLLARLSLGFRNRIHVLSLTRRGALFLFLVIGLVFSTMNTGNNLLILVLSFLFSALLVSGLVSDLILQKLTISLGIPERIHALQDVACLVTLHNMKRYFPAFALELKSRKRHPGTHSDQSDFFVQEKNFPYIRAGENLTLKLRCSFRRRGEYPVEGFDISTSFPFGFFSRRRKLEAQGRILVYPALFDLRSVFFFHPHLRGRDELNQRGLGSSLYNIRQYQDGDSARHVDWKSTAKLNHLMVKDFAREEQSVMNLFFSSYLPDQSVLALAQFEKALSYLTSLGDYYWKQGQSFRFVSESCEIGVSERRSDFQELMKYLACVQPSKKNRVSELQLDLPCVLFVAGEAPVPAGIPTVDYLKL